MGAAGSRDWVPIGSEAEVLELLRKIDEKGQGFLMLDDVIKFPSAWGFIRSLPVLFYFDELKDGRFTFQTFLDAFEFFNRCKSQMREELTKSEYSEIMKRGVLLAADNESESLPVFGKGSPFRHFANVNKVRSVFVSGEDGHGDEQTSTDVSRRKSGVCRYGQQVELFGAEQANDSPLSCSSESAAENVVYSEHATTRAVGERVRLKMFKELTVFLSEDGTREEFMQWLWEVTDVGKEGYITLSELSTLLHILEYDNIYLPLLSFSNRPGISPEKRILSEFDLAGRGTLSRDHFLILSDLITREYENWESRHLESVGNCELGRIIGRGASGIVRFASNLDTHEKHALKIVKKGNCAYMSRLDHEIESLRILADHAHVVELQEVLEDDENMYLRMELLGGGNLIDLVRLYPNSLLPEEVVRYYMRQLFETLADCHRLGVCHRDVRLENMLLDNDAQLKLGDFGQSGVFTPGWDMFSTTLVGSIYNLSPEQVLGMCYSGRKIDVWSAGVAMYCLLVGHPPFYDSDSTALLTAIVNGTYETPVNLSADAIDLISKMINVNPDERPHFEDLLSHSWFEEGHEEPPVLDNIEIDIHPLYVRRPDLAEMIIARVLWQHKTHFHLGEVDVDYLPDDVEGMWCMKCHYPSLDLKFALTLCTRPVEPLEKKDPVETDTHVQDGFALARDSGWPLMEGGPAHVANSALQRTLTRYPYKTHVGPAAPSAAAKRKSLTLHSGREPNSSTDITGCLKTNNNTGRRKAFLSVSFQEGEKGTFAKLCRKLKGVCDETLWEAAEKQAKMLLLRSSLPKAASESKPCNPIPSQ